MYTLVYRYVFVLSVQKLPHATGFVWFVFKLSRGVAYGVVFGFFSHARTCPWETHVRKDGRVKYYYGAP